MAALSLTTSLAAGQGISLQLQAPGAPADSRMPLLLQPEGGTTPPRITNFTATLANAAS